MSTTITYKDNLLTTVDNSIKILRTAGKYLEGDIVLADITAKSQPNENDPIRFFDYDGTLVASYTEVPESLPEAPTHEGLIAQGWNWTLEDIATQFASSGACDVGQMYTTSDGRTRIYVTVSDTTKSFWLGLAPKGTLSIDWGDSSETSNMTGTSLTTVKTVQHSYATAGSYIISVETVSGKFAFYNNSPDFTRLLGKYESISSNFNWSYGGCVTTIELGDGAEIGTNAFAALFNMRNITIPDNVTSIGTYAFTNCYALQSITIPNSVTNIGRNTFQNCYALHFVAISKGMTSIDYYAFGYCYALHSITIPDGVTDIRGSAFIDCRTLHSVIIPNSVTSIDNSTFKNCYVLESITIPDGVTDISGSVFQGCQSLHSVVIPDGITNISSGAFAYCYTLESIIIPEGVINIGDTAFYNCYNMNEYHFLPTTPPTLASTSAFGNIMTGCKMYVPYSADHSILEAYKTATNWSRYASYMVEEGE